MFLRLGTKCDVIEPNRIRIRNQRLQKRKVSRFTVGCRNFSNCCNLFCQVSSLFNFFNESICHNYTNCMSQQALFQVFSNFFKFVENWLRLEFCPFLPTNDVPLYILNHFSQSQQNLFIFLIITIKYKLSLSNKQVMSNKTLLLL